VSVLSLADNGRSFCFGSIKYLLDTIYNIFRSASPCSPSESFGSKQQSMALMIMTLASAKSSAKFRIRQRNAFGDFAGELEKWFEELFLFPTNAK